MTEKYEWRKEEKKLYIPKQKPEIIEVPEFNFITINGVGSPAESIFTECIGALYSVAYGIKMIPKKEESKPPGYFDFTVFPLEGIWDINDEAKKRFNGTIAKDDLVYQLMIRQPEFVDKSFFKNILEIVKKKKANPLLEQVKFESITDGKCIQMLHVGRFEDEPETFKKMETFAEENGLTRLSKVHREIYLSDARKVVPEKLKTVLRFKVK
ncbi:GyrI-like domain-containing protein [Pseudoalteromonas piscicida]|uniref:GyrI-like domain-containing protein n=1 Tax=Pseudoalteromonas piscicida TaxID=43662 RepID=UPI001C98C2E0|nr:GyrI-like domain-containing protein [Pseudoalteromonas piscicida]QZO14568.1 GyrI-like domain-containing protein [Pseudoalteromonas piscicida]